MGEPAPVPPIGGTGATRPAKKKPICTTTSVAQAARPPGLPPPRHPALGFAPQTPNVMLPFAERLMCMPPWCPLLAAAVGTDISARLACAWKRAAHLLPAFFAGRGLGGTGTGSPNRGRGGDAPRKKETYLHNNVSCSGRKAAGATAAPAPRAGVCTPDPEFDAGSC